MDRKGPKSKEFDRLDLVRSGRYEHLLTGRRACEELKKNRLALIEYQKSEALKKAEENLRAYREKKLEPKQSATVKPGLVARKLEALLARREQATADRAAAKKANEKK